MVFKNCSLDNGFSCNGILSLWYSKKLKFIMNEEITSWFGNIINYFIFVYIFQKTLNTNCFNGFDMFLALFGLGTSIFIQVTVVINKFLLRRKL